MSALVDERTSNGMKDIYSRNRSGRERSGQIFETWRLTMSASSNAISLRSLLSLDCCERIFERLGSRLNHQVFRADVFCCSFAKQREQRNHLWRFHLVVSTVTPSTTERLIIPTSISDAFSQGQAGAGCGAADDAELTGYIGIAEQGGDFACGSSECVLLVDRCVV